MTTSLSPSLGPNLSPITLLLADDHCLIRAGMRSQLEPLGRFRIVEAWDAASLQAIIQAEAHIDLALIDVLMPGMSDWQATLEFCARHSQLPILLVTGLDPAPFIARFQRLANVRGLVTKQHSASQLRTVVDLALAGQPVWWNAALVLSPNPPARAVSPGHAAQPAELLTPRLQQVARQVASGLSNAEVARQLGLSEGTVKNYLKDIFKLLGVSNRTQLALKLQAIAAPLPP